MSKRILYTKPSITELEIGYATDAATNGWGERCYEYIDRFELLFRDYLGGEICDCHVKLYRRLAYGNGCVRNRCWR